LAGRSGEVALYRAQWLERQGVGARPHALELPHPAVTFRKPAYLKATKFSLSIHGTHNSLYTLSFLKQGVRDLIFAGLALSSPRNISPVF
jgi:hypothetical protein